MSRCDAGNLADLNAPAQQIIGAAIEVHRHLGPGLLESAFETCSAYELDELRLSYGQQKALPLMCKEIRLDQGYRVDLLVERKVVAEVKAIDLIAPVHDVQVLSYLRFSGCKIGLSSDSRSRCSRMAFAASSCSGSLCVSVSPPCDSV